ncbi:MAG TPA: copper-binding protein [Rhodobacteraceae bacterium]|jgi:copper(I)-binding protein|nr:copper-binding protein [Paracoccaceae bacterium]
MLRKLLMAAVAATSFALPAFATDSTIVIEDAYARSSMKMAKTGAAFMVIKNTGTVDDRMISATSDASKRVELHTHVEKTVDGQTFMKMGIMEGGFPVPANGETVLKRGGMHVMFMGLTGPFVHGETVKATLVFEKAGEIEVEIPIDLERKPAKDEMMMHKHKDANN